MYCIMSVLYIFGAKNPPFFIPFVDEYCSYGDNICSYPPLSFPIVGQYSPP